MTLKIGYARPTLISLDNVPETIALWIVPGTTGFTATATSTATVAAVSSSAVVTATTTATATVTAAAVTTFTGTTANGDPWKLWVPSTAGAGTPLVHFAHAYGGSYLDPGTATYNSFLAMVIAAGWAIVSTAYSAGAPDQAWGAPVIAGGNQRATETCFMQADAAAKAAVTSPTTLVTKLAYGGSMGCIVLLDSFRYETGITTIAGMYGVCGVFNLADLYAGAHQGHINTTYNIPSGGSYAAQTAGRDPALATAAQNAGVTGALRFRHLFSAGDEVCYPDLNAAAFVSSFAGLSGVLEASALVAPDNGTHLQGYAVGALAAADFVAFGSRAIAGTDATAAAVPAAPSSVAGALAATQNQITWVDPTTPSANLSGWNVYVGGVKKNVSLIKRDITGAWLNNAGKTSTNTTWTDTANAPFTANHVGQPFYGDHVPQGTTVAAFISSSQVTLSAATTATDNVGRLRYVAPLPLFTITGLSPNTGYTATLRSVTIDGVESTDSPSVSFTTPSAAGAVVSTTTASAVVTATRTDTAAVTAVTTASAVVAANVAGTGAVASTTTAAATVAATRTDTASAATTTTTTSTITANIVGTGAVVSTTTASAVVTATRTDTGAVTATTTAVRSVTATRTDTGAGAVNTTTTTIATATATTSGVINTTITTVATVTAAAPSLVAWPPYVTNATIDTAAAAGP